MLEHRCFSGLSHSETQQKLCRIDLLSIRIISSTAWQIFQLLGSIATRSSSLKLQSRLFPAESRDVCPVKSVIMAGMKILRNIIIVFALAAVALATTACPEKGPAEKAGEKIDKAIDKTEDAAKEATDAAKDATK